MNRPRRALLAALVICHSACLGAPKYGGEGAECSSDEDCFAELSCIDDVCTAANGEDAGGDAAPNDMTPGPDAGPDAPDQRPTPDAAPDAPPDLGPCSGACTDPTPVCDAATDTCVECLATTDCTAGVCNPATSNCVECVETSDCTDAICDPATNTCVECTANTDCPDAAASACVTNVCTPCSTNDDCTHIGGAGVCDAGTCVECTGTDYAACGGNVCDSRLKTCTGFAPGSGNLCGECVSDAQCRDGQLCIPMMFDKADGTGPAEVGTFCLWEQASVGANAPNGDCFTVRPYVRATASTSLDGVASTFCGLAVSTCPALEHYRTDCATAGMDDLCGAPGFNDGYCVAAGALTTKCTVACGGDDDCRPGFSCDTNTNPPTCAL